MSTTPQDLNWVEKRAACTIAKVFNELCDGIVEDVKLANSIRESELDQEFHTNMHSDGTTIFVGQPNQVPRRRVIVGITGEKIEVRNEATNEKWDVTIGLNDEGRCVLRQSDSTELEQWQFRKKALEALLFGEGRL